MVRLMADAGARSLKYIGSVRERYSLVLKMKDDLRLLPLAMRSSTEVCKLPASSSCTVSHERVNDASQVYACYKVSTIVLILSNLHNLLYLLPCPSSCPLFVCR